jgi:hypothetical protein
MLLAGGACTQQGGPAERGAIAPDDVGASPLVALPPEAPLAQERERIARVPARLGAVLRLTPEEYGEMVPARDDPTLALAVPLAMALENARRLHLPTSKPLPAQAVAYLEKHYPRELLGAARYSIGSVEISLANAINVFNPGTAVTLPGLIVFPFEPDWSSAVTRHWWAHEVHHLRQYEWLGGTLEFAWAYLNYCTALENDADQHADQTVRANGDAPPPRSRHCAM